MGGIGDVASGVLRVSTARWERRSSGIGDFRNETLLPDDTLFIDSPLLGDGLLINNPLPDDVLFKVSSRSPSMLPEEVRWRPRPT